jgi:antitoxin HicB
MSTRNKLRRPTQEAAQSGYFARITRQRPSGYLAEFPDLPGCLTEGDTLESALAAAREALSGWLHVALKHGDEVPSGRARRGAGYHRIVPDLDVLIPLAVLSARKRRGLTQQQVAKALGISQQAYRKLEVPGKSNPTLRTLERLSEVLGLELTLRAA